MIQFYTTIIVLSAVLLSADMILRYMEKIPNFGIKREFVRFKGKTIPYEFFFPNSPFSLFLTSLFMGTIGLLLTLNGMIWYLSIFFSVIYAFLFCFLLRYIIRRNVNKYKGLTPPTGEEAAGIEGFAAEEIRGDSCGLIEFEYKGRTYLKNAVSEYETTIEKFEKVIILHEINDLYVVESIAEVYNIFSEKEDK